MAADSGNLIESLTLRYAMARGFFARLSEITGRATFRIKRGQPDETIAEIARRWKLDDRRRQFLVDLGRTKTGAAFIDQQVQDINRAAFHRSAFALNALTQVGFVDLPAQLSLSLPLLKASLAAANLILAWIAHAAMRRHVRALLAGPNALPPKRRLWLFRNPKYNRAVRKSSRPLARSARLEKSVYRPAYFFNAISIFLGSQFILPPDKLIFPIGFIVGKLAGLFSTLVVLFDVWRGIRAGDNARMAREREIAAYRELDI